MLLISTIDQSNLAETVPVIEMKGKMKHCHPRVTRDYLTSGIYRLIARFYEKYVISLPQK